MNQKDKNIAKAKQNLEDFFNSLPEESRKKALAYQAHLEEMAKLDSQGMLGVIAKETARKNAELQNVLEERIMPILKKSTSVKMAWIKS